VPVLKAENDLLQKQLATLQAEQRKTGRQVDAAVLEQTQKAVLEANQKLRQETEATTALRREKEAVETRLKSLNGTLSNLRQENDKLTKRLAATQSKTDKRKANDDLAKRLQAVNTELQSLKSANHSLAVENAALENKLRELAARQTRHGAQALADTPAPSSSKAKAREERADKAQVKRLERERDLLQKQLDAANQALAARAKEQKPSSSAAQARSRPSGKGSSPSAGRERISPSFPASQPIISIPSWPPNRPSLCSILSTKPWPPSCGCGPSQRRSGSSLRTGRSSPGSSIRPFRRPGSRSLSPPPGTRRGS